MVTDHQPVTGSIRPATFRFVSLLQGIGELEQAGVLHGETLVKLLCNRAACQLQLNKPLPALVDSQRAVRVSRCLPAGSSLKVQLRVVFHHGFMGLPSVLPSSTGGVAGCTAPRTLQSDLPHISPLAKKLLTCLAFCRWVLATPRLFPCTVLPDQAGVSSFAPVTCTLPRRQIYCLHVCIFDSNAVLPRLSLTA